MKMDLKKLKGMKMPSKGMAEKEASDDLDLESLGAGEEGSPEEEAAESPEEEKKEMASGEGDMLDSLSDEELLHEIMKRGLAPEVEKMDSHGQAGGEGEDYASEPMPPSASSSKSEKY